MDPERVLSGFCLGSEDEGYRHDPDPLRGIHFVSLFRTQSNRSLGSLRSCRIWDLAKEDGIDADSRQPGGDFRLSPEN